MGAGEGGAQSDVVAGAAVEADCLEAICVTKAPSMTATPATITSPKRPRLVDGAPLPDALFLFIFLVFVVIILR